jgi:sugar O-acyltransferase (sialic acid O-acetyltransferase NeuD family)
VSQTPIMADLSPGDCERIIIVGAGGFGREVLQWARHAWPEHAHKIAGFLSADPTKLDGHAPTLPIIGSPAEFKPQSSDGFLLAVGIPHLRRRVVERLEASAARFLTLIHPTAIVADTAQIGLGTVVCPYAIVSDAVRLGRFVLVNYHVALGHDSAVGDFAVLSPYATLGGFATVGLDVFLALHVTVGPNVMLGQGTIVSANSSVLTATPADSIVFGVPGRVAPHVVATTPTSAGRS